MRPDTDGGTTPGVQTFRVEGGVTVLFAFAKNVEILIAHALDLFRPEARENVATALREFAAAHAFVAVLHFGADLAIAGAGDDTSGALDWLASRGNFLQ